MEGITVIICCYNSATRIGETLEYIGAQKVPPALRWEVIVVNNNSKDRTREVAESFRATHAIDIKVVDEPNPGLLYARLTGLQHASYDVIVFCDDDNHLADNYISTAAVMMTRYPEVGIAGGRVEPKLPAYPGKWIESNYGALAIGHQGPHEKRTDWVFGAGMVIRKKIFNDFTEKGIRLFLSGRVGTRQTSGDDAEICTLARFIGYQVLYTPELLLFHQISPHRLTRWSFVKANFLNVYHAVYFFLLHAQINHPEQGKWAVWLRFAGSCVRQCFYFLPRAVFGNFRFFSFIMLYQNLQLIAWLVFRLRRFSGLYDSIKINLRHG